jgi:hypothetical protein
MHEVLPRAIGAVLAHHAKAGPQALAENADIKAQRGVQGDDAQTRQLRGGSQQPGNARAQQQGGKASGGRCFQVLEQ